MLFHSSRCYESFIKGCSLLVFELFRSNKHIIVLETGEERVPASHCSSLAFSRSFCIFLGISHSHLKGNLEEILGFFKEDVDDLQCWYVDINYLLTDCWLSGCVVRHNNYFALFFLSFFFGLLNPHSNCVRHRLTVEPFLYLFWISSDGETWRMKEKICAHNVFYSFS